MRKPVAGVVFIKQGKLLLLASSLIAATPVRNMVKWFTVNPLWLILQSQAY